MIQILQNSHFSADLFDHEIINCGLVVSLVLFEVGLELLGGHVEVREGQFFHRVLVVAFDYLVHWAKCTYALKVN